MRCKVLNLVTNTDIEETVNNFVTDVGHVVLELVTCTIDPTQPENILMFIFYYHK